MRHTPPWGVVRMRHTPPRIAVNVPIWLSISVHNCALYVIDVVITLPRAFFAHYSANCTYVIDVIT